MSRLNKEMRIQRALGLENMYSVEFLVITPAPLVPWAVKEGYSPPPHIDRELKGEFQVRALNLVDAHAFAETVIKTNAQSLITWLPAVINGDVPISDIVIENVIVLEVAKVVYDF